MKAKRNGWLAVCRIMAAFAGLVPGAWADTETLDGVMWGYGVADGAATVTNAVPATGALAIPSVLGGCPVTGIGPSAFSGCTNLASVAFPDSVTSIGEGAFSSCRGLESVAISDGVLDVGDSAFAYCSGLKTVTLGNGATNIGSGAFNECRGLRTLTLGDHVASIGSEAFRGCSGLTGVVLPASLQTLGAAAFGACSNLASIAVDTANPWHVGWNGLVFSGNMDTIECCPAGKTGACTLPDGVVHVGAYAFLGCAGVTSLTIPDGVADIGEHAFEGCSGLKALSIGEGVVRIGEEAFHGCTGLTTVTIPDGTADIGERAFYNCTGLKTLTVGNGVTNIAPHAFYGCTALRTLGLGNKLANIGDYAFDRCSGLVILDIPDCVENIGGSAFYGCTGLTTVAVGNSVTNIGSYAFYGCRGLESVSLGRNVASIGTGAFAACSGLSGFAVSAGNPSYASVDGVLATRDMQTLIAFPGGRTGTYVVPDGVTAIGGHAFEGCAGLEGVAIGNSVTNIGTEAFRGCDGLESVSIPVGVVSIGTAAFAYCHNLTGIQVDAANPAYASKAGVLFAKSLATLKSCPGGRRGVYSVPPSVTVIGPYAFAGCSGLTTLTIPPSVIRIRKYAFAGCSGLTTLTLPDSVQALEATASDVHSHYPAYTLVLLALTKPWMGLVGCSRLQAVFFPEKLMGSRLGRVFLYDYEMTGFGAPGCLLVRGKPPAAEGDEAYGAWLSERWEKTPEWLPREGDEDGDGATNWEEYVADTDPTDAEERLEARIRVEDGRVAVEAVPANAGRMYRILGKKELADGTWTEVDPASNLVRDGWKFFRAAAALPEPDVLIK